MNDEYYLNDHIKRHIRSKIFHSIILTVLFYMIFVMIFVVYVVTKRLPNGNFHFNPIFGVVLLIILIMPIRIFKPYSYLFDSAWCGIIENVIPIEIFVGTANYSKYVREHGRVTHRGTYIDGVSLLIKKDDGTKVKCKFKAHSDEYINYYKKGDKVIKHRGLEILEKVNKSKDEHILCLACGHLTDILEYKCEECGMIIK